MTKQGKVRAMRTTKPHSKNSHAPCPLCSRKTQHCVDLRLEMQVLKMSSASWGLAYMATTFSPYNNSCLVLVAGDRMRILRSGSNQHSATPVIGGRTALSSVCTRLLMLRSSYRVRNGFPVR